MLFGNDKERKSLYMVVGSSKALFMLGDKEQSWLSNGAVLAYYLQC